MNARPDLAAPLDPNDLERAADPGARSVPSSAAVTVIRGDSIRPEPIAWLWSGWLARGKVHVLAGAPGTGKTSAALALAATVTTGGRWPDGTRAEPGHVLLWSGEDDPKDTLVPRLIASGADLPRVHFVVSVTDEDGPRAFDPAEDAELLGDHAAQMDPAPSLLIVDPIVSAVAGDSHKNAEVRRALQPLVDLAMTRRCAVLGISHFSKGTMGRDPVERVTGSLAFGALARVVLAAAKLPEEDGGGRMLARAKNNIGCDTGGFQYDLETVELGAFPGVETTRVLWGEALDGTARELLSKAETFADPDEQSLLDDAKGFLRSMLADGPVPSKQIKREADEAGHAWATIRRAKDALGIEAHKEGMKGPWKWAPPPEDAHETPKIPISEQGASSGNDEHLRDGRAQEQDRLINRPPVTCETCRHFTPSETSPGAGLGSCRIDAPASERSPALWPRAEHTCEDWRP
ncbi:MAG: AAA family ATPase [Pseudomonadota bacterium]|nr:AAA family ATPase [Pseudomonadota bacterium]